MQSSATDYGDERWSARSQMTEAERGVLMFGKNGGWDWVVEHYEKAIAALNKIPAHARTDYDRQLYLEANYEAMLAAERHIERCKEKRYEKSYQETLNTIMHKPRLFAAQILRAYRRLPKEMDVDTCLKLTASYLMMGGDDSQQDAFSYFLHEARAMLARKFNEHTGEEAYAALNQKQLRALSWCLCRIGFQCKQLGNQEDAVNYYSLAVDVFSRTELSLTGDDYLYFPHINSEVGKGVGQKLRT